MKETVDFYRSEKVVGTFEEDRYSTPRGKLRYQLQNQMFLELITGTDNPVLEIAGGTGRFSRQFTGMKKELVVFDASIAMLTKNRGGISESASHPSYVQGLAQTLPFASNTFGLVFCVDMFSHIQDPEPILSEMSRVLKKGGNLVINFTNKSSLMGLAASTFSNPLRIFLGKMDVFSTYHWSGRFLKLIRDKGIIFNRTTGLFFIDPRVYRFPFGPRLFQALTAMENWMSRQNCRFLYEQVWIKGTKV